MATRLEAVDLSPQFASEAEYRKHLKKWQLRLLNLEQALRNSDRSVLIAFEGWDASGKGGAIKRLTSPLDPRGYKVYPIAAPTAEELTHHYLWRFWTHTPSQGTLVIFDRSWYGRVLVERVEKITKRADWERAFEEINCFEQQLTDSGVVVIKFWLQISEAEQLRRFEEREKSPFKKWKITPDDWRNRKRRKQYEVAAEEMFERTDTAVCPWHIISGEHKWWARIEVLKAVVKRVEAALGVNGKD
jgi:AMP-polyphosphate phosphotransferase